MYFPLRISGMDLISLMMRSSLGRLRYLGLYMTNTAAGLLPSNCKSSLRATSTTPGTALQHSQIYEPNTAHCSTYPSAEMLASCSWGHSAGSARSMLNLYLEDLSCSWKYGWYIFPSQSNSPVSLTIVP